MYNRTVSLKAFSAEGGFLVPPSLEIRQRPRLLPVNLTSVGNTVGGTAVPYRSPITHQGQREAVATGAFSRVLQDKKKDVRLYTDHRYSVDSLLASRKSGSLEIADSPTGLEFEAMLPDTERSKHLLALIEQKAVGASIGFRVATSKYELVDGVRQWTDLDLGEISIVTDPAYKEATVERRQEEALDDWLNIFIIRRKHARV